MQSHDDQEKIDALVKFAEHAGATQARGLPPACVQVEDRLANFCREPKCPNYGQSMSCPPHVSGPEGIRKLLQSCKHALVIRIEIESASLHGADRPAVMRLLHEITAEVEMEAKRLGFPESIGFAGGSCKPSFCPEHPNCRVLAEHGECRHPHHARTSMSGYGVNVGELMKSAGWSNRLFSSEDEGDQLAWVAGLVLLC
jgi:predicted metal-binding protein